MTAARDYDVLVLGGGMGGIAAAALFATAGRRVAVIERHSEIGGYAHPVHVGGAIFPHQVQYLMGCEDGGPMHRFLERIGLDRDVTFDRLDTDGYDVAIAPGLRFPIPMSVTRLREHMQDRWPRAAAGIGRFFGEMAAIYAEARGDERIVYPRDIFRAPLAHRAILRHVRHTVRDRFERHALPTEARFVLGCQAGNLSAPPSEASFLMHTAMMTTYCRGAFYPRRGMHDMLAKIRGAITARGGDVLTGTSVERIVTEGTRVARVETSAGPFSGSLVVSNLDPQTTDALAGARRRPYRYSDAVVTGYFVARREGALARLRRCNYWVYPEACVDRVYARQTKEHDWAAPWVFLSSPSTLAEPGALASDGHVMLVALTFVDAKAFERRAAAEGAAPLARHFEERFLRAIATAVGEDVSSAVVARHVTTPVDTLASLAAPGANVYGARLTPENMNLRRVTPETRFSNLFLVGASAAYPGIMGVTLGSLNLFERLQQRS